MNRLCLFVVIACLIPLRPLAQTQNIQQRAAAMLDKARQLSDIRSPNAPAFRLTATFSFVGKNLETLEGTYTEIWVSDSQWRRETVVKDLRRIEVGGATRRWLLDNTADFPDLAAQLPTVLSFPSRFMSQAFGSISDHPEFVPPAECVVSEPDSHHLKSAFCFDRATGLLMEKILPEVRPQNTVDNSCDYGLFEKFGGYRFPREAICFEDRHRKLSAKVIDLSFEPSPDPALFTPPPKAIEIGICHAQLQHPRAINAPNPRVPFGSRDRNSQVTLSILVDTKGKPQNVKVVKSGGASFDEAAVSAVRTWSFKPATCNGEPMPIPIAIEVDFRTFR